MLPFLGIMRLETKMFFLGYEKAFQRGSIIISFSIVVDSLIVMKLGAGDDREMAW